ncbi:MAG: DUF1761 domain-containing protein [Saprospiraceae bacterium]
MPTNFYMLFVAALIPMVVGSIYYSPKVMGNAWMKSNGFTLESLQGTNMGLLLGSTYVLSVLIAFSLQYIVVHQTGAFSMMMPEVLEAGSDANKEFMGLMERYGDRYRTFKHGALHGFITSLFLVLPVMGINAAFERRGWKYVLIHFGYWAITLLLMGGLLCATLKWEM